MTSSKLDAEFQEQVEQFLEEISDMFCDYFLSYSAKTPKSIELFVVDPYSTDWNNIVASEVITSRDLAGPKAMFKIARLVSYLDFSTM